MLSPPLHRRHQHQHLHHHLRLHHNTTSTSTSTTAATTTRTPRLSGNKRLTSHPCTAAYNPSSTTARWEEKQHPILHNLLSPECATASFWDGSQPCSPAHSLQVVCMSARLLCELWNILIHPGLSLANVSFRQRVSVLI